MLATVDVGVHDASEELFNPDSVFMSFFNGFEQHSAELLNVVLLEGIHVVPLKASKEIFGVAGFVFGLQIDEEFLQLIGYAVFFCYFFRIVTV